MFNDFPGTRDRHGRRDDETQETQRMRRSPRPSSRLRRGCIRCHNLPRFAKCHRRSIRYLGGRPIPGPSSTYRSASRRRGSACWERGHDRRGQARADGVDGARPGPGVPEQSGRGAVHLALPAAERPIPVGHDPHRGWPALSHRGGGQGSHGRAGLRGRALRGADQPGRRHVRAGRPRPGAADHPAHRVRELRARLRRSAARDQRGHRPAGRSVRRARQAHPRRHRLSGARGEPFRRGDHDRAVLGHRECGRPWPRRHATPCRRSAGAGEIGGGGPESGPGAGEAGRQAG